MKKFASWLGQTARRHSGKILTAAAVTGGAVSANAQTDATVLATTVNTGFTDFAPITIAIAGFILVWRLAKRLLHA
jgi:hypothetical protein